MARLQVRLRGEAGHGGDALLHEALERRLVEPAGALRVERLQPQQRRLAATLMVGARLRVERSGRAVGTRCGRAVRAGGLWARGAQRTCSSHSVLSSCASPHAAA